MTTLRFAHAPSYNGPTSYPVFLRATTMRHAIVCFLAVLGSAGCTRSADKPASAPAAPEKPKAESTLAFTTLSKKAYARVENGIKTQPASVQEVQQRLALTGWVMAKPGKEV